jgi:signal transduction histidine kinase
VRATTVAGARVAAVATLVIAAVLVVAAASLDLFVGRRVLWEVDQSLLQRLGAVAASDEPLAREGPAPAAGIDAAPVYLWWVPANGPARALTQDSPALPSGARKGSGMPFSLPTAGANFRYESLGFRGGYLVAGQDLAAPLHIERVLLIAELMIGPVVLLAVFGGVLVISIRSAAPVEAARRRLLEMTADASHELRTPLTVIEAEIELARSTPADAAADREALDHIARESRRLKSIVEDLLWLARFDGTAPASAALGPVDVGSVVAACAGRFAPVAAGRRVALEVRTAPDAFIEATAEWVDRLAGTLIDNACRYAPDGGRVRVTAQAESGRVLLVVEDDGPGLPEGVRLFDRFRRATEKPGGAGLGLAIADSVVRSTSGRWRVERSELGGALMEVSWRAVPPPNGHGGAEAGAAAPAHGRPARAAP